MNKQDIEQIEAELKLKLPSFYSDQMLDYPFKGWDCEDWMLCNDPQEIIRQNNENRKGGFFDTDWPNHFFIIGFDGCGNYYFIDLETNKERVYFADHESHFDPSDPSKLEEIYESMDAYFACIKEVEEDMRSAELNSSTSVVKKKWWQFWK